MKISFFGAAGCVTGSNYLIETENYRFLVDCGMFQGNKTLKENNYKNFAYNPADIDFVILTHAHIDHTGLLPKLVKHGFTGPVYATKPTVDMLKSLLPDSARIQEVEVLQKNRRNERKGLPPLEPIYDELDADKAISLLKGVDRYKDFSPADGCNVVFHNAGHILGSAVVEIKVTDKNETRKIVFTGDLGEDDHPIVNDPDRIKSTDFLLVESTYGNRIRKEVTKEERLSAIANVFKEAEKRGGKILIPAFSLERTQDLLHDILILKERKEISGIKVIVDSPLSKELTKVFVKYPELYDEDATNLRNKMGGLFDHPDFRFTESVEESKALNPLNNIVIMSASGMCDAGRIKHHLKHNLWNPANTVIFVGYQAEGTLGRLILDGAKKVRIHGEEVTVGAVIDQIPGYSGHADQNGLLKWMKTIENNPRQIFVVHGEPESASEFASLIKNDFGFNVTVPAMNDSFDLLGYDESTKPVAKASEIVERPALKPLKRDSHNLYADFMLRLADYMRFEKDEDNRRQKLEELLTKLK